MKTICECENCILKYRLVGKKISKSVLYTWDNRGWGQWAYFKQMSKENLWYLVVGFYFSHKRFLNPCLMRFLGYKFSKFPLVWSSTECASWKCHLPGLQLLTLYQSCARCPNSGEHENRQSRLWNWEQSHFLSFAINKTIMALIIQQVSGPDAVSCIIIQRSLKSASYWWTAEIRNPTWKP